MHGIASGYAQVRPQQLTIRKQAERRGSTGQLTVKKRRAECPSDERLKNDATLYPEVLLEPGHDPDVLDNVSGFYLLSTRTIHGFPE